MRSLTAPPRSIRILPREVAARIAAGEVVERPASVVKELVENALDAGASDVRIEVRGGGLTLIRVSDDGCGIPPHELRLACQRHATSKLTSDDLRDIQTLGFRGEALPSIAAVADLTLVSAAGDSGVGRRITLVDGRVVVAEPAPRTRGTTVTVRNLFQTVPARLAAAAQPRSESAHVGQVVRRLAVAAPDARLTLMLDDRVALRTSGSGNVETLLAELYGHALAGNLLSLGSVVAGSARLSGVVSRPDITRPGRGQIHIVVNGRWAHPRGLLAALVAAYRPLLPRGRHPVLAVTIETAPDRVDANIHPAKLEVRLLDERAIASALAERIRSALGRQPIPLRLTGPASGWDAATLGVAETPTPWDEGPIVTPGLPPLRLVGQLHQRLILLEGPDGLYLVDQHRAHERILYERLREAHQPSGPREAEPVLLQDPMLLELRPAQVQRFSRWIETLGAAGFECQVFGGRTFLLRSMPPLLGVVPAAIADGLSGIGNEAALVEGVLELADEEPAEGEAWWDRFLVRLACRGAVRRGRVLDRLAMRALVDYLGHTSAPTVCPHGSPLLMQVSERDLARQFDWR